MPSLSPTTLVGVAAVGGLELLAFLAAAALILSQKGSRRAALVAPLVPLVSLPTIVAVALGSFRFVGAMASMAMTGSEGGAAVVALGRECWLLTRGTGVGLVLLGLVGLTGGLVRTGTDDAAPECSPLRALTLFLLPAAALVILAGMVREQRTALHVARLVVEDGSPANEAALAAYGFGEGGGSIAALSRRIALAATLGSAGSVLAAVILLGLAATGGLLAWPVRAGPAFAAAATLLWVVVLAMGVVVAAGLYSPS